ncbi:hypothetical protein V6Z12_A10G261100 [Gossypium hirsutum]
MMSASLKIQYRWWSSTNTLFPVAGAENSATLLLHKL